MANNFRGFAERMRKRAISIEARAQMLQRRVALVVDQAVVLSTPVNTGRARANWQVTVGQPAGGVVDSFPRGQKGSTGSEAAQQAINQGRAVIESSVQGAPIVITNNVPYIVPLNEGHSLQAPAAFVELAIQQGVAAVKGTTILEN